LTGRNRDVPDELLGDLDPIDRECCEISERRIAGAEIVDGDPTVGA
jgi:hypothetical protein